MTAGPDRAQRRCSTGPWPFINIGSVRRPVALFGTNGVRGVVGQDMTAPLALELGLAFGTWVPQGSRIAVGRDARATGPMLLDAFTAGIQATGVDVVDLGVVPSPAAQLHVRDHADAGAVITASHNPPEWNGIKLILGDGTETTPGEEAEIEAIHAAKGWRLAPWDAVGGRREDDTAAEAYVEAVLAQVDVEAIRSAGLKVVYDAGGGAGCGAGPRLLERLGVEAVLLSCDLDGAFTDRPSEPTPENARRCMEAVVADDAHLGVLQDGDADRAVFVDGGGAYVWGDRALALVARHELPRHGSRTVVTAVSSSSCIRDAAEAAGGRVDWTRVGSPVIVRHMQETGAPLGGEDNGGFMFARHQLATDGLMATAFLLELVATTGRSLAHLLEDIPAYALEKRKVPLPPGDRAALMERLRAEARGRTGVTGLDLQDGVKAYFEEGWLLVRPSGTEPLLRIQAEARTAPEAQALADRAQAWIEAVRDGAAGA